MPSSLAIIEFVAYCGGLAKYLSLMEEINRDKRPVYEIATERHLSSTKISRFLSRHYKRVYEPDEIMRSVLEHEIGLQEAALAESRRNLARKGSTPILSLPDTRGSGT